MTGISAPSPSHTTGRAVSHSAVELSDSLTFGLRCSQPACRPRPASLPIRVPTVESLLHASFSFTSRLRLAFRYGYHHRSRLAPFIQLDSARAGHTGAGIPSASSLASEVFIPIYKKLYDMPMAYLLTAKYPLLVVTFIPDFLDLTSSFLNDPSRTSSGGLNPIAYWLRISS